MKQFLAGILASLLIPVAVFATVAELNVGPVIKADGAQAIQRMGREGETITIELGGKYEESTERNQTFSVTTALAGVTVAATHVSPIAANTGTPIIAIVNPANSGKNAAITKAQCAWVSGTAGAGGLAWNIGCGSAITAATTVPIANNGSSASSSMRGIAGTAITSGPVGVLLKPVQNCTVFAAAIAATTVGSNCSEEVEGNIVVPPGCWAGIAAATAGTSPIVQCSLSWREGPQ
jgi:hypothetical protein